MPAAVSPPRAHSPADLSKSNAELPIALTPRASSPVTPPEDVAAARVEAEGPQIARSNVAPRLLVLPENDRRTVVDGMEVRTWLLAMPNGAHTSVRAADVSSEHYHWNGLRRWVGQIPAFVTLPDTLAATIDYRRLVIDGAPMQLSSAPNALGRVLTGRDVRGLVLLATDLPNRYF